MVWNLYLAVVPTVLALALFRRSMRAGVAWFAGFAVWLLFCRTRPTC